MSRILGAGITFRSNPESPRPDPRSSGEAGRWPKEVPMERTGRLAKKKKKKKISLPLNTDFSKPVKIIMSEAGVETCKDAYFHAGCTTRMWTLWVDRYRLDGTFTGSKHENFEKLSLWHRSS
jgi:hypothetical protein